MAATLMRSAFAGLAVRQPIARQHFLRSSAAASPIIQRFSSSAGDDSAAASRTEIDALVRNSKVVVFMKGVPDAPRCGFSNAVVQIMRMHGCPYDSHNVLDSEAVRQGVKEYSDWPTIPQIYIGGEFVGGCDIVLQMHQNGELIEELQKVGIRSALLDAEEREAGATKAETTETKEKK